MRSQIRKETVMKRIFAIICGLMVAALVFSCTEKPVEPETPDTPNTEDVPAEPEQPEPGTPEPEPEQEIVPMLDFVFNADGTASDASQNRYAINTYSGFSLMTWDNPGYQQGRMARFSHTIGAGISDSYYKFFYQGDRKFRDKMSDGYSLEAIVMLDAVPDGKDELKAFSSMEQGGTGIMVTNSSQGRELTFLTNVSSSGSSNWVWGRTGIVPERGRYYHIIGVWDKENNEARVYVDGELKQTIKTTGNFNFPKSQACWWFCVGGDPAPSAVTSAWRGDVAMARIYDEALTTEWVQEHWSQSGTAIPDAVYQPENVMYMTTCNVTAGGKLTIAGKGFESTDQLDIVSLDGAYNAGCWCTATSTHIVADLPKDIRDGKYKLFLRRNTNTYPVGIADLKITEEANSLKRPKIIAHRGYHKDGAPENSLEALAKAQEFGFYGSEVDVWITTDGVIVCNHDGVLSGKKLQDCTYEQVKDLKLSNGEVLPTFETTLAQLAESDATKLVLEFKSHSTTERNNAAVDACLKMIKDKGLTHMVDYIAFDYEVCKRVAASLPDATIGYLNGDKSPAEVHADGISCIDYSYGTLNSHQAWITEAHELGMEVNVWTVNSDNDMMVWMGRGVDYITTDNPDRLQLIIEAFCAE